MQSLDPPGSITQEAYERLRSDLLSGRLPAGARLKIGELCKSFGLNLSAIRESLSRLTSEGLVTFEPQRGYRAASISADELRDLTEVRIEIEGSCLRRAVAAGDVAWETGIVASFHQLSRTAKPVPGSEGDAWFRAHDAFHAALVAGCGSPWLLRLRAQLYMQSERYRRLSVHPSASRDVDAEHRALMETAIARDAERLVMLMRDHLDRTTCILLDQAVARQGVA